MFWTATMCQIVPSFSWKYIFIEPVHFLDWIPSKPFGCCVHCHLKRYILPFWFISYLCFVILSYYWPLFQFYGVGLKISVSNIQPSTIGVWKYVSHHLFLLADFTWFVCHSFLNDLCMYLTKHWAVYGSLTSSSSLQSAVQVILFAWICFAYLTWPGFLNGCCKYMYMYAPFSPIRILISVLLILHHE